MAKTSLKVSQILAWADACHERTGVWPRSTSGHIPGVPGETWKQVDAALRLGYRGLRGGSSLARLLARQRGVPPYRAQRTLSVEQILAWADAYHERTGCWPKCSAERIRGTRMRWSHVNRALRGGLYGLPRAFSLARLLEERRGVPRYLSGRRPLTQEQILAWADAYRARTGQWPTRLAGRIAGEARETWRGVDFALMYGRRGLPAGSTLNRFLAVHRPGPPRTPVDRGADPGLGRCLPGQDRPVAHGLLRSG